MHLQAQAPLLGRLLRRAAALRDAGPINKLRMAGGRKHAAVSRGGRGPVETAGRCPRKKAKGLETRRGWGLLIIHLEPSELVTHGLKPAQEGVVVLWRSLNKKGRSEPHARLRKEVVLQGRRSGGSSSTTAFAIRDLGWSFYRD